MGKPYADATARSYQELKHELQSARGRTRSTDLRARFDVVVCEGAGSPAEINLRQGDLANMGLARAANLPVLVIGDIDRGGVFPSLYGTLALLEPEDQALIAGFLINKFRGDPSILDPGLDMLREPHRTRTRTASCRGSTARSSTPRTRSRSRQDHTTPAARWTSP